MMKKILIPLFLFSASLQAALPPLAQELAEVRRLLDSKELTELVPMGVQISSINKTESGYTLAISNGTTVDVQVVYAPAAHIGPALFSLHFTKR